MQICFFREPRYPWFNVRDCQRNWDAGVQPIKRTIISNQNVMPYKNNPADFGNDESTHSPDDSCRLFYSDLNEIAMVGPLIGSCYLEAKDGLRMKIYSSCGGPPVWEPGGRLVAVPIWARYSDEGLRQSIGVVDVVKKELRIFSKKFSVVHLGSFNKNIINGNVGVVGGWDSFWFDIESEQVGKVVILGP